MSLSFTRIENKMITGTWGPGTQGPEDHFEYYIALQQLGIANIQQYSQSLPMQ